MDSELAALSATGASTLVSLLVTDSWSHARELLRRFLSRGDADTSAITDLEGVRGRLLAARTAGHPCDAHDTVEQWGARVRQLLEVHAASCAELRELVTSLQRLRDEPAQPATVHNSIEGGVQHGPVIQSGRITGLTIHTTHPDD
ncbi:hypothetical protein [Streptomyces asoensis]|uniref:Uncharacterized protein n=1 Tax=Streptomyces asoensis TaxID=249586 RepID=A0ABQ3RY21_9ACTN|nr:hypothetical protein [Streptomyces asoensis]GGQ53771.1 hypothetical protein GCM10010496_15560 [Streptomyces asoensis]GHI60647.1 hypothetical protein Saso_22970 [Streptomyces asoensis]